MPHTSCPRLPLCGSLLLAAWACRHEPSPSLDADGPDGTTRTGVVYPTVSRVSRADVNLVYVTLGWTGHEWILIQLYPAKLPKPTTKIGLNKEPIPGKDTIH